MPCLSGEKIFIFLVKDASCPRSFCFSGCWKALQEPQSARTPFNPLTFLERQKRHHLFRALLLVNELCDYSSGEYKALKSLLQIKPWIRQIPGAFQRRFCWCSLGAAHQSQAPSWQGNDLTRLNLHPEASEWNTQAFNWHNSELYVCYWLTHWLNVN